MRNRLRKIGIISFLLVFVFVFSGGCVKKQEVPQGIVDLEFWGVFDETNDYSEIIDAYRDINSAVRDVSYKKFGTTSEYRKDLINALAAGNGPDIFMINSAWIPDFEDKIAFAFPEILGEKEFRENFVDVAANDLINQDGTVMGSTLSVDSLALYYNKDIFNANGITAPPRTWDEFVDVARKMTKISETGEIVQSGAAMGSVNNINRSTDVIDMLMFQHDVLMPQRGDDRINLNQTIREEEEFVSGGSDALKFYTDFSNSGSPSYTWNSDMHYSLDEFYEGDLAMMLNFSWHYETIRSKNSKLNFAVTLIPQKDPSRPSNVSNYWVLVVSKNKIINQNNLQGQTVVTNETRIAEAWQFVKFLTVKNDGSFGLINPASKEKLFYSVDIDPAKMYLDATKKPAARRDLIEGQKNDPFLGPFAQGNLIAKSWIRKNSDQIELVWNDIVSSINKGSITVSQALGIANNRIDVLFRD